MVVLTLLALVALATGPTTAHAAKDLSAKEIMVKAHKGNSSLLTMVRMELREDEPDWADIQKQTKELVVLGTALGRTKPPQGDQQSWSTLTQQYLANVKALDAAAGRRDKSVTDGALKKLMGSCSVCHKVHRPDDD
jgi:cytochrome c556